MTHNLFEGVVFSKFNININRNPTEIYEIGKSTPYIINGLNEISANCNFVLRSDSQLKDLKDAFMNQKKLSFYVPNFGESYYIKNAVITSMNMNSSYRNTYDVDIDLNVEDATLRPTIKIKFKGSNKSVKVPYRDYYMISNEYGISAVENMTYKEFKDKVLVENI